MPRYLFAFLLLALLPAISLAQRNVIFIIADDLGNDYCGFYENHFDTVAMPNIRRLLGRGIKFRNAWSNPLCSPTRAGALTGRYSFRTGVGSAVGGAGSAVLDTAEITIPRLLNKFTPNGIAKANIGKWHLHLPTPVSNYIFPNKMGYDHYEGCFSGALSSYTDWTKVTNGVATRVTRYATTETADNAIEWIRAQKKPFFVWLAFNAPHAPFHLPPAGLHLDTSLSGSASDITANPKAYFKAAVEALDHEIGRLFDSLKVMNKWDSTEFIFIGDNGNDPFVAQTSGSSKGSIYQQGVCVPFIVSGPSVVNPGRASDALVNTHDIFATILELFGYKNWPAQIPSNKPVDGKSLLPILQNQSAEIRPWIFTEVFKSPAAQGDGKAMRNKDYKLLHFDNGTEKFYNLGTDPRESKDLLTGTLNTTEKNNYDYLCDEMTKLVGSGNFCRTNSGISAPLPAPANLVYPNPFSSRIHVNRSVPAAKYCLYSATGKLVFSGTSIEQQDFSTLPDGLYFLRSKNQNQAFRLIKQSH